DGDDDVAGVGEALAYVFQIVARDAEIDGVGAPATYQRHHSRLDRVDDLAGRKRRAGWRQFVAIRQNADARRFSYDHRSDVSGGSERDCARRHDPAGRHKRLALREVEPCAPDVARLVLDGGQGDRVALAPRVLLDQ